MTIWREFRDNLNYRCDISDEIGIDNISSHLNIETVDLKKRVRKFINTVKTRKDLIQDIITRKSANDLSCSGFEYVNSIANHILESETLQLNASKDILKEIFSGFIVLMNLRNHVSRSTVRIIKWEPVLRVGVDSNNGVYPIPCAIIEDLKP
ncbi:hypothetical protein Tco_0612187, partial [Tanacetum coccineum]